MAQRAVIQRFLQLKLKTYFFTGLLVVGPIALTFMVVQWIVTGLDSFLAGLLPAAFHPDRLLGFHVPGLGLIAGVLIILLAGALAANYLGNKLFVYSERLLYRIPLVRIIYTLFRQVADSTFGKERKGFRQVVLLEYPRAGIWSVGFLTGVTEGEVQQLLEKRMLNVFVPTTPNPTSGFYLLVPEEDTIPLAMSVDEAFKLVISGGMVTPKGKKGPGRARPARSGQ
ncbi:MAG: hypothetical protein COX17_04595 [Deltaproteobacteria bacterium CG23_combo_of_CG06-09_8_20_14_all_60_8]|nr:MAG: hypothetical protein AUK28_10995 [Desulfobacterales bacterium CG2_30_60_27]PIP43886.1 MAG: hypothetical protein COX17_04595 [Deltaproteobacteria bacterium CG23_combo_of_CG06-09_8_20_14_all_60_8]